LHARSAKFESISEQRYVKSGYESKIVRELTFEKKIENVRELAFEKKIPPRTRFDKLGSIVLTCIIYTIY